MGEGIPRTIVTSPHVPLFGPKLLSALFPPRSNPSTSSPPSPANTPAWREPPQPLEPLGPLLPIPCPLELAVGLVRLLSAPFAARGPAQDKDPSVHGATASE